MAGMFVEDFVSIVGDVNTRSRRFFSLVGSKTTQKPKTYTKDDYHRPIKTRVRPGVPAE
jgi:hypothetical protein